MKFAHLADTHLGYRQFGLFEREKDFYEVFEKIIDRIIEEKVDFVIHSGDLFDNARPSPLALFTFQKGLIKLKNANIPVYAIAGNHDSVMRKGSIPPQVLFKKFGLKVISPINTNYMYDDVFIGGLPFYPSSQYKNLKNKLSELSKKAANHEKSILVLHQGIDKYFNLQYELEIGDVPDNFTYYAMGHLHNYIHDDFGNGKLVYPGSSEVWKTTELPDYRKNGKGFVIVDLDGKKPVVNTVGFTGQSASVEWRVRDASTMYHSTASYFEVYGYFHYSELMPGATDTVKRSIKWALGEGTESGLFTTANNDMYYAINYTPNALFDIISQDAYLNNNSPVGVKRWFDKFEFVIFAIGEDLYNYHLIANSNSAIQDVPNYTNVTNGNGIMSARVAKNKFVTIMENSRIKICEDNERFGFINDPNR